MSIITGSTQQLFIEQMNLLFNEIKLNKDQLPYISEEAFERFCQSGFPTVRNEEWKYTNTEPFLKRSYSIPDRDNVQLNNDDLSGLLTTFQCHRVVFLNGYFQSQLSVILEDDSSVEITAIKDCLSLYTDMIKMADEILPKDGWKYLNDAFILDGKCITIKKNKVAKYPVHIIHLTDQNKQALFIQNKNLIIVEQGAQATCIESFYSTALKPVLSNHILHLNIADDGHLTWFKHQQLQDRAEGQQTLINYTSASLHKQSRLNIYTLALNGSLIRNNLHIKLCGANSEARLNGFYAPSDKQLIDNHTLVDHAVPNCYSNELYKGIINDNAKAVFNGKILVRKDAQKTNAFQSNKNILLSDNAIVYTKPQLEIFADDVKCSHGATSGQLDDESLFYLQARGISKREAYKMLMLAFAEDITADIQFDELRNWLNRCIEEKIQ